MNVAKANKSNTKKDHQWDLFFLDFHSIEKIIKNQERFTYAFR